MARWDRVGGWVSEGGGVGESGRGEGREGQEGVRMGEEETTLGKDCLRTTFHVPDSMYLTSHSTKYGYHSLLSVRFTTHYSLYFWPPTAHCLPLHVSGMRPSSSS